MGERTDAGEKGDDLILTKNKTFEASLAISLLRSCSFNSSISLTNKNNGRL